MQRSGVDLLAAIAVFEVDGATFDVAWPTTAGLLANIPAIAYAEYSYAVVFTRHFGVMLPES